MATPRKHHWVPQFYLRAFADRQDPERIFLIRKETGEILRANIKDTAAKRDLYTFTGDSGDKDPKTVEDNLAKLEDVIAPAIRDVLDGESINDGNKVGLACFAALQMTRTPRMRDQASRMMGEMAKQTHQIIAGHKDYFHKMYEEMRRETGLETDISAEEVRQWALKGNYDLTIDDEYSMAASLKMLEECTKTFLAMQWALFSPASDDGYFVTCDYPYGLMNPDLLSEDWKPVGLASNETTIHLPLSPQLYAMGSWQGVEGYHKVTREFVRHLNTFTTARAERFVILHVEDRALSRFVKNLYDRARYR